eukprot:jgi/Mesvir1/25527/Mv01776-RA.1
MESDRRSSSPADSGDEKRRHHRPSDSDEEGPEKKRAEKISNLKAMHDLRGNIPAPISRRPSLNERQAFVHKVVALVELMEELKIEKPLEFLRSTRLYDSSANLRFFKLLERGANNKAPLDWFLKEVIRLFQPKQEDLLMEHLGNFVGWMCPPGCDRLENFREYCDMLDESIIPWDPAVQLIQWVRAADFSPEERTCVMSQLSGCLADLVEGRRRLETLLSGSKLADLTARTAKVSKKCPSHKNPSPKDEQKN